MFFENRNICKIKYVHFFSLQDEHADLDANLWAVIEQCSSELILAQNKFTRLGVLPKKDQIDALSAKFQVEFFFFFFL